MKGFGLVEIMIAMLIGMVGMLAIMQAFAVNERYKENTVGASSAQTNGSISLFTIERDIRMAGYGISNSAAFNCNTIRYHYNGRYSSPPGGGTGAPLPSLTMAPVVITQGVGTAPDSIMVMSSGSAYRFAPATLTQNMTSASVAIDVDDVTGFAQGDLVVATSGTTCAMMQLSQIQSAGLKLEHTSGSSTLFNPDSGSNTLPAFAAGSQLFNLGQPQIRTYEVTNNSLTVTEWMLSLVAGTSAANVLVNEVVDLQAEYGVDDGSNGGTANDGILDGFTTTTPSTAAGWGQVLAVRLAVLTRGGYERPDAGGACTTTPASRPPTWAAGNLNVPGGLPSCYRYRVFETVVPLRNMIWRDA